MAASKGRRMQGQFFWKVLCGCLWFLAGMGFFLPGAMAEEQTVIRVGYDPSGIYLYQGEDGGFQGYNLEYLYEIAKYTDWKYEFVPYPQWADAIAALENNEIDLLPTVLRSPEREGRMLFPMRAMSAVHVALVVGREDTQYFYGDVAALQGAHIGVRRDTVDTNSFRNWAAARKLQYDEVVFDSQQDLLTALDEKRIDAAAMSYVGRARDYRAIAEFAPRLMYFAVAPEREDVLRSLDMAMEQIAAFNPGFFERIVQEYTKQSAAPQPVFSRAERALLDEAGTVRVTLLRHGFPFSLQTEDGSYEGIVPDLLKRLSELSGLRFSFVPVDSQSEAVEAVAEGRADMIGRVGNNLVSAKREGLRLTTPYVVDSMVSLTRKGTDEVHRIAFLGIFQKEKLIQALAPDTAMAFEVYPDTQKAFEALDRGAADALYVDSATAAYFLNTHRAAEYQINALPEYRYTMSFGVSEQADPRLASILDKCIRFVSVDEMAGIITNHRQPENRLIADVVEQLPMRYLFLLLLLAVLTAAVMGYTSFSLWRKRGVEKRMADIKEKNRQIQVDLATARQVNSIREEFFSSISHDMRTPLNGITGFTRLAAEADTLEAARGYIEKIKVANGLLVDLVEDTLQLSKFERGNFQLTLENFDIREFAADIAAPARLLAEEKGLRFVLDMAALENRRVVADRVNTRKIFWNLLSNAVKFTSAGGEVQVILSSCISPQGSFVLWLKVTDTGIGISREFLPRIYEPFAQERQSGKTEYIGNGLGLTIVRRLVDVMGGELSITSKQGKGTEINLELYFELAPEAQAAEKLVKLPDYSMLQGKRILLCEDNELNADITKELLAEQNMSVLWAENGQRGLELFQSAEPGSIDAILMDLRMPVMDGYAATQAIRAMERPDAKTIPILALSADAFSEDVAYCLEIGMNAHIAKPLDPDRLYQELVHWCAAKK